MIENKYHNVILKKKKLKLKSYCLHRSPTLQMVVQQYVLKSILCGNLFQYKSSNFISSKERFWYKNKSNFKFMLKELFIFHSLW